MGKAYAGKSVLVSGSTSGIGLGGTLGAMPEHKRKRIAKETLDIFAPLANRLGIWQIKWELEDLGFRYLNPKKYNQIADQLEDRERHREPQIEAIKENLGKMLAANNIKAEISGRPKHIYSIYKKMTQKGKPFDLVRDVRAVRLIVQDVPSCYAALGVIHTHWRPIPGEFDDYIAAPKDNFYQSLHTAVIYDDKRPLEVSHSCCRALAPHFRNLSDEMLEALAEKNGLVGINFWPGFLQDGYDAKQTALFEKTAADHGLPADRAAIFIADPAVREKFYADFLVRWAAVKKTLPQVDVKTIVDHIDHTSRSPATPTMSGSARTSTA